MNNYELATDEFSFSYKRYKRKMPWKAFKKFGWTKGQVLCEKYDLIITDHETKSEKALRIAKKFNMTNLNKGINKINNGVSQFSEMMGTEEKPTRKRKGKRRAERHDDTFDMDLGPAPKLNLWGKQEKFRL